MRKPRRYVTGLFFSALVLIFPLPSLAGPWLEAGDPGLRHDLQLLADLGVLTTPTSIWPIPWGAVAGDLNRVDPTRLPPAHRGAWHRLSTRAQAASVRRWVKPSLSLAVAGDRPVLRWFNATPREQGELAVGVEGMKGRFAYRLNGRWLDLGDPNEELFDLGLDEDDAFPDLRFDGEDVRYDGSYIAFGAGNWAFSVGALDRYWGPAWGGGLILSNNPRPIPAVALQRIRSAPFDVPLLKYLGPWHLTTFIGQLESDRVVEDALLWGMRIAFRPLRGLEIGLSRTAQWGGTNTRTGEDRPTDFDTFRRLFAGDDNDGGSPDEPGNQLAGGDIRWSFSIFSQPMAVYSELIGEDEAGGVPSRFIGQAGAETWGPLPWDGSSYRVFLEVAETTSEFHKDEARFNYAYEHGIYRTGYRYRGWSIGYPTDNDSRLATFGVLGTDSRGRHVNLIIRSGELNRDDDARGNTVAPVAADLFEWQVVVGAPLRWGRGSFGFGATRLEPWQAEVDDAIFGFAQWEISF
ncbi:MAG: capsule assembly Wzi family protein [Pseudomonadota bacterium]|nr:capsule assembly Wzi family protein [Pseudomonadota bacterium]